VTRNFKTRSRSSPAAFPASAAVERFGRIDILVNNAGIAAAAPVQDIAVEQWDRIIGVHLRGTFLMTREVLPQMIVLPRAPPARRS
jgi:NAD(P)-dependent dehydrogenase (short-subunit alcohol dehydrogenase family)